MHIYRFLVGYEKGEAGNNSFYHLSIPHTFFTFHYHFSLSLKLSPRARPQETFCLVDD